jgi:hypothetical protein
MTVQKGKGICDVAEMATYFNFSAFFTTVVQIVCRYLEILNNNAAQTHEL